MTPRCRFPLGAILSALAVAGALAQSPASPDGIVDSIIKFTAADGTPLEAKLSLPAGAKVPVPVVFHLHGAGPRNYDHRVRYRDADGELRQTRYYDFYARELGRHGLAFFRMSKRGCSSDDNGAPLVHRPLFSNATATVLLADYARALDALRQRTDIDAKRIILSGTSEGARLAPQLVLRSPAGIVGLVLMSHQPDNLKNTVVWQNTVGVWRAVTRLIPEAADDALTKTEYDEAVKRDASIVPRLPFVKIDADANGILTSAELKAFVRPRLDLILKAVEDRDDDFLWVSLINLSSAYLLDGWEAEPTHAFLLKLDIPIGIFHGELDGTTRVEGVRETEAAFKAARKTNLTVKTYPGLDHDLGWTPLTAKERGPQPFQDAFQFAADLARPR